MVLDLSFGKIFCKFCKSFERSKPLIIFGKFLTVGIPVRSIFAKGKRRKIFGQHRTLHTGNVLLAMFSQCGFTAVLVEMLKMEILRMVTE